MELNPNIPVIVEKWPGVFRVDPPTPAVHMVSTPGLSNDMWVRDIFLRNEPIDLGAAAFHIVETFQPLDDAVVWGR